MYIYIVFALYLGSKVLCQGVRKPFSGDHTLVSDSNVFPYAVAILKQSTYISAGALIDESWVLTGGDALFLLRESARELRVRLGSINYRKGGVLVPIKFFEIHPYFNDTKPEYDIALIRLPDPVRFTPSLSPIKLQRKPREIIATHFIVTSWPIPTGKNSDELQTLKSMDLIIRRRMLTVSHLHPTDPEKCQDELKVLEINSTETLMCLDQALDSQPCSRDVGAPVVLNGILWGIVSSYKPEECELAPGSTLVTLVASPNINSWIHSVVRAHRWTNAPYRVVVENEVEEYKDCEYDEGTVEEMERNEGTKME